MWVDGGAKGDVGVQERVAVGPPFVAYAVDDTPVHDAACVACYVLLEGAEDSLVWVVRDNDYGGWICESRGEEGGEGAACAQLNDCVRYQEVEDLRLEPTHRSFRPRGEAHAQCALQVGGMERIDEQREACSPGW